MTFSTRPLQPNGPRPSAEDEPHPEEPRHAAATVDPIGITHPAAGGAADPVLALIAHDLRSPLTVLSTAVQLIARIADGLSEPERTRLAQSITLAKMAIAQLDTQTRALTGPPATGAPSSPAPAAPLDLVKLTRLMAHFYQQTTGRHQIIVNAHMPELPGPWTRPHLQRVLGNVLTNAIKFSPDGGEIRVTVGREEDRLGRWAIVRVQNNGCGIPEPDLPYLAQPGFRARNVAAIAGSGSGLASVRAVVTQYGGTLMITSTAGEPTTVLIRLPLREAGDAQRSPEVL